MSILHQSATTRAGNVRQLDRRSLVKVLGASTVAITGISASIPAGAQEATPTADTISSGVAYAEIDGKTLFLDVYQPPLRDAPRPGVLVFHPGGFVDGDRSWMEEFARGLAAAGYVAFAVGYRLYDSGDEQGYWPAPVIDAQRAVRWVRSHANTYGIDPERLASFGYSAGGLLALQLGMRDTLDNSDPDLAEFSSRVACVVNIAAATDAAIGWTIPGNAESQALILGGTAEQVPEAHRDFAVLTHVAADAAPTLILHSADDTWTPVEHAWRLAAALDEAGVEVVLCELAGIEHTAWTWANAGPWTLAFLDRQLQPER